MLRFFELVAANDDPGPFLLLGDGAFGAEAQADFALVGIDADDADVKHVSHVDDLLRRGDLLIAQFADVQQALQPVFQLNESAEAGQLGDDAAHQIAGAVAAGDLILPGIRFKLLEPEGDATLIRVHLEDHGLDRIALLHHLGRMGDLARPGHVAYVQQAVYALFDLDEGAVAGQVPDPTDDLGSRRVVLLNQFPRVLLGLLHAEADLFLLLVDAQHDHVDHVADGHDLAGVVDAARPGHLADVYEALDAFFELHEGPIAHQVDDFAGDGGGDGVLLLDVLPGARGLLLQPEGDLLLLDVHVEDHHLDQVVDGYDLAGMADPAPAHVRDVQQAVNAAQVDEGAEVHDVLDLARACLALLQLPEQAGGHDLALALNELAPGDDDVASILVDLEDLARQPGADEVGDLARSPDVHLAGRQEDGNADVHQQPALDLADDRAGDDVALFVTGNHALPVADAIGLALGQLDQPGVVLHGFQKHLHSVADLRGLVMLPLVPGYCPLALVADVHHHFVGGEADNPPFQDGVDAVILDRLVEPLLKFFAAQAL